MTTFKLTDIEEQKTNLEYELNCLKNLIDNRSDNIIIENSVDEYNSLKQLEWDLRFIGYDLNNIQITPYNPVNLKYLDGNKWYFKLNYL